MTPTVFRGVGWRRASVRLASLVLAYLGVFAVLWGLGMVARTPRGWALVIVPLVVLVTGRTWAWRRVSVELAEGQLRYEGASPTRDFDLPMEAITAVYLDRSLPSSPLVLVLDDGDERVCGELSASASRALQAHLMELGIPGSK